MVTDASLVHRNIVNWALHTQFEWTADYYTVVTFETGETPFALDFVVNEVWTNLGAPQKTCTTGETVLRPWLERSSFTTLEANVHISEVCGALLYKSIVSRNDPERYGKGQR